MKRITAKIKGRKIHLDFNGFLGDTCLTEENKIRVILVKMGVKTDVEYSDNKREGETNGIAERERN